MSPWVILGLSMPINFVFFRLICFYLNRRGYRKPIPAEMPVTQKEILTSAPETITPQLDPVHEASYGQIPAVPEPISTRPEPAGELVSAK